jgi:hypothetical protein
VWHICLLTIGVLEQRDPSCPIGIVLDLNNLCGNPKLLALEVDLPVASLVTTTPVPHADVTVVIATTTFLERFEQ